MVLKNVGAKSNFASLMFRFHIVPLQKLLDRMCYLQVLGLIFNGCMCVCVCRRLVLKKDKSALPFGKLKLEACHLSTQLNYTVHCLSVCVCVCAWVNVCLCVCV